MAPARSRDDALARLADASERMRVIRASAAQSASAPLAPQADSMAERAVPRGATLPASARATPAGRSSHGVAGAAEEKEEYDVIIEDSSSSDSDPPSAIRAAEDASRAIAGAQAASQHIPNAPATTARPQPTNGSTTDINVCANIGERALYTALDSEDEISARAPDPVWADSDDEYVPGPLDRYAYTGGDDPDADVNEDDALWHAMPNKDEIHQWGTTGWDAAPVRDTPEREYAHLYDGLLDPAPEVVAIAENPLWLFFYFFPKKLFHVMAEESNRYALRRLGTKAAEIHRWQSQNAARDNMPSEFVETEQQILARLRVHFQRFKPEEYTKLFGLFIARVMYPHDALARHWNPNSSGAIPAGTFQKVMPRSRFDDLIKNWHFADDNDPRARTDRVWKVRPLIEALQETFKRGHQASPFLSFGEGAVLSPPRSDWVRWRRRFEESESDTKLFLTCCSTSAYCLRFEVYCGKKTNEDERVVDQTAGPIAVLRNVDLALPARRTQYHVVTMDRKFTSVPLVLELLARKVYAIGRVHQRRVGLPVQLMDDEDERRPRNVPPGPCAAARSRAESSLVACRWWDSRPLLLIGTGASLEVRSIERHSRITGEMEQVPCPKIAVDYQKHKQGVETFNRMRHSDLSVQRVFRFKKLYKSIALALLDCALTNAYIAHKQTYMGRAKKYMTRCEFLVTLHAQLIQLQPSDLALPVEERPAAPSGPEQVPPARISFLRPPPRQVQQRLEPPTTTAPVPERPVETAPQKVVVSPTASTLAPALVNHAAHYPCETQDFLEATNGQGRKRMARGCKVCSYLAPKGTRGLNTKFFCPGCSGDHSVDVYLCIMARHISGGVRKTCFQIWHNDWQCGKQLPHGEKRLHFRPPTGKKRRRRSEHESGDDQQD